MGTESLLKAQKLTFKWFNSDLQNITIMKMKKLLIAALGFCLLVGNTVHSQSLVGDSWASAKQKKSANIVVTYTYAPKFADVVDGQRSGLCFDIMKDFETYVKTKYGVILNIDYKTLNDAKDFDLFLNVVKASKGGVFGLGDITITEERKKDYNFSDTYFSNMAILATNNSVPTLSSIENIGKEFAGKRAIIQNGTTHEDRMKEFKEKYYPLLVIETTKGYAESNKKVIADANYFTYIDFSTYLDVVSNRIPLKRHEVGDQKGEDFGFIMPKSSDWAPVFNEFLRADGGYTQSVEYRKLLADNLGGHVLKLMNAITK